MLSAHGQTSSWVSLTFQGLGACPVSPRHCRQAPFTLSIKPGDGSYQAFLANETRYSSLTRKFPDRAADLFAKSEAAAQARFAHLEKLVELYK